MTSSAAPEGGLSLRSRPMLAVALTVAFYLLPVAIAVALIASPIALRASSGHGNLWVTLAMVGAGAAILRAIVPERDRFEPPGPELSVVCAPVSAHHQCGRPARGGPAVESAGTTQ